MRIRELKIKGYKGFNEEATFNFSNHLTVIAGINGKGKTTILNSLRLVLQRLLPDISPAPKRRITIQPMDFNEAAEEFEISINANCANIPISYSVKCDARWRRLYPAQRLSESVKEAVKNAYGDPSRDDDQAPLVVFYTTDRSGFRFPKAAAYVSEIGQAMAYNGALTNRLVDYNDFIARFRVVSTSIDGNNSLNNWRIRTLQSINKAIEAFLNGFTELHVESHPPKLLIHKGEEILDIRQLSDGERSLIAMITDLSRRLALANPELENPLHGAGVVLIDEIELHLHPKWQVEITEKLRSIFPNIQFIVTTHSPFIIQAAGEGEVISLDGLDVDPFGRSLEEVAKYVMDVENVEYSSKVKNMREVGREYLRLAEESKNANAERKQIIQEEIIKLLAPFTNNPAYTALLESKGLIETD